MRPWTLTSHVLFPLALAGLLAGCSGSGGSSAGGNVLPSGSGPVTTYGGYSPSGSTTLNEFQTYTFSASATDGTIGRTVTSFVWSFGDQTAAQTVAASSSACTVTHKYSGTGSFTGSVYGVDDQGTAGTAAPFSVTVAAGSSPVTVSFTNAPTSGLSVGVGQSINYNFIVSASDTAAGATISASGIAFTAGDVSGFTPVVGTVTANGDGTFTIPVAYPGGTTTASRTVTPTVQATDSLGNASAVVQSPFTLTTTVASQPPTVLITTPATPSTSGWTSKPVSLAFTLGDLTGNVVWYTVAWGDGTTSTGNTGTGNTVVGVSVSLTHAYADAFAYAPNSNPSKATVTVTADNGSTPTPLPSASCTFVISYNAYPTATITSPQASDVLPSTTALPSNPATGLVNPPSATSPDLVVIPVGGMLNFSGAGTAPGSGDPGLTYTWTFQNGVPVNAALASTANPGSVFFNGASGVITPCLVTLTVTDAFNRVSSNGPAAKVNTYEKWVIVDGTNSQVFNLSFLFRQRSGTPAPDTYAYAQTDANGNGAVVSIFQDGMNNAYTVTGGSGASVAIPVRSNVPFWLSIPATVGGSTGDTNGYLFRIPNQPGVDPDMESASPGALALSQGTAFAFQNSSYPWNPQLQLTSASSFGTELTSAGQRRFQGSVNIFNNECFASGSLVLTPNVRWLDRLSVQTTDALPVLNFSGIFPTSASLLADFSGLQGYQLIPEWFVFLKAMETRDWNTLVPSSNLGGFGTISTPTDMGFVVSDTYNGDTQSSQHWSVSAMQAFRAPASTTDPYDFDVMKAISQGTGNTALADAVVLSNGANGAGGNPDPSAGLNPKPLVSNVLNFLGGLVQTDPGSGPLRGGLADITVPYDANAIDRPPIQSVTYNAFTTRSDFSYAEYLWTSAWARPLVLNRTNLNWQDTALFSGSYIPTDPTAPDECTSNSGTQNLTFPFFFYSSPTNPWPSIAKVSPDNSAYNLNVVNGGVFDASSPVTENGLTGTETAVGRFFWTAFTPHYNADEGALISRTWLADNVTNPNQVPTGFSAATTSDATTAWGFLPPQDTAIDKRARGADGLPLSPATTGGYRVMWYNPTKNGTSGPVAPDFWAVQLVSGGSSQIFLLSASYPRITAPTLGDSLVTDLAVYLPSTESTYQPNDLAGPGYCWFDVPPELRPAAGATVTVFALKSILKNNPVPGARMINRSEWLEAVKTVTASISTVPNGNDVSFAHKIPFRYPWDIVVVNGPAVPVAP